MEQTDKNPELFVMPTGRGKIREAQLQTFANYITAISKRITFKLSSRGWCYQLESFNVINKGQFNRVQDILNECRKKGFLPIDFVAEEKARQFTGVLKVTDLDPRSQLWKKLFFMKTPSIYHTPDYWYNEDYYIQMLVEKVDLVTLFDPICKKYHIPIANSKGWSSILQRAEMAWRFQKYEDKEQTPVLLYCGDFDPFGLAISNTLKKNLIDIAEGTGWLPTNLIIDRFGLNYDFIMKHNISWIDNLISGSGKKPNYKNPIVRDYIAKYGERKVEANAIVVIVREARKLCKEAIEKYLGDDAIKRMSGKKDVIREEYEELAKEIELKENIDQLLKKLQEGGDIEYD